MKLKRYLPLCISAALIVACSKTADTESAAITPIKVDLTAGQAADTSDYLNRDIKDDIFYFVLPDRFYNGNPDNDNGSKDIPISQGGFFPEVESGFHGGDIQGIEEKLDYLQGMGISAIWMTPILRNRAAQDSYAHHGYWVIDFTQIDPHFGTNDDLKSLIDAAHKRGMKIFFDIIVNHTADIIKYQECHGPDKPDLEEFQVCEFKTMQQVAKGQGYTPYVPAKWGNVKTPEWLNDPKYYYNQGDSTWQGESVINGDFVGLDDLNTSHPEVIAGMIDIFKNVISDFRPDGFRIDTVKHVDMALWQDFSPAIMQHAKDIGIPQFFLFGEVFSGDQAVLSDFTTRGKMPSVLDFALNFTATDTFYTPKTDGNIPKRLFDNDDYYNDADSDASMLLNFIGNHDLGRMGRVLMQSYPDASDEEYLARIKLANAFMYLSRGIPVVYYGDEQGFTGEGGGDVGSREDMFPSKIPSYNDNDLFGTDKTTADFNFDTQHPLYQAFAELGALRMRHPALRHGIHQGRYFSDDNKVFAFSRVAKEEQVEYLAAFNANSTTQQIELSASASSYTTIAGESAVVTEGKVTVTLPPLSYALYKANSKLAPASQLSVALTDNKVENGRLKLHYQVGDTQAGDLNLYQVTTEYQDSKGNLVTGATDYTFPYTAFIQQELVSGVTEVKVTVSNLNGQSISEVFNLK